MKLNFNSISAIVAGDKVFTLVKNGDILTLLSVDINLEIVNKLASFKGSNGFILKAQEEKFLINIDDKLYFAENNTWKIVLTTTKTENIFWHITEADGKVFAQEYGEPLTGIYVSENLREWKRRVTNFDIDKQSKHFHYLTYDPYRNWLIATLGDGCLIRAVISSDLGHSWTPLYKGPWQFLPVVPLRDKIVFGMDSGIARGGIGIYYPSKEKWEFIFLKWYGAFVRFAQMADLKQLSNGIWIVALGTPQAILISKDLKNWYPLHIKSLSESFNYHMNVSEGKNIVVCSTGNSIFVFDKDEFDNVFNMKPVMSSYKAYIDRFIGIGFILKRRIATI
ncbi:MAG: hypothetical protein QXP55_01485 [Nitrososphaerales archaeon]